MKELHAEISWSFSNFVSISLRHEARFWYGCGNRTFTSGEGTQVTGKWSSVWRVDKRGATTVSEWWLYAVNDSSMTVGGQNFRCASRETFVCNNAFFALLLGFMPKRDRQRGSVTWWVESSSLLFVQRSPRECFREGTRWYIVILGLENYFITSYLNYLALSSPEDTSYTSDEQFEFLTPNRNLPTSSPCRKQLWK